MTKIQHTSRLITTFISILLLVCLTVGSATAQTIYAVSGSNLVSFEAQTPGSITKTVAISGLGAGQTLSGIDFRPATGELYAIGYNNATGEARLYTINRGTGLATAIGAVAVTLKAGMTDIGFDFNPTVDRIRVTGSDNSNFRMHPVTGAIAATDGGLAYAATDANAGADPAVSTVAYSNSYIGTTSTTLFNYDLGLNIITTQVPPNNGTLNTLGASGIMVNPADPTVDLDIFFSPTAGMNMGFLAANTGSSMNDDLYRIDLTTGTATSVGSIGAGVPVQDIAVLIDRTVPATVTGDLLYALTTGNNLISFDSKLPGTIRTLVAVTGIATGQVLSGLDFRPATGELYGIGYNAGTGETRLYSINPSTGGATAIGAAPVTLNMNMGKIGFDFNPTVDRVRITGSNNSNFRMHPVTGALAATDGLLAFAAGDPNVAVDPSVGAVAYSNSFNGTTTTTLFNYEDSLNIFTTQAPPNNGTLNTLGTSGIVLNPADPSADLDIYYDAAAAQNRAYLSANVGTQTGDNLYSVNLSTGMTTLIGKIGLGIATTDIAAFIKTQVTLTCPADVSVIAPAGKSGAVATYTAPTATTTCPNGGATVTLISGLASGSTFPAGTTDVCYASADACGNTDTCCFKVTVVESACDSKQVGCLRFEVLSIRRDAQGDEVYRIRVTNNCTPALSYVAFQLPKGITAVSPGTNTTYTGMSGQTYTVRSPNFSPFYSIRFKSDGTGINSGTSDIFEYTLPKISDVNYIHVFARLADGTGTEAYFNTFNCPVQPFTDNSSLQNRGDSGIEKMQHSTESIAVFPNPSSGIVYIDLSSQENQHFDLNVYNATGQLVQSRSAEAGTIPQINLNENLTNGVYLLLITAADGTRETQRLILQR